ncbi:MAG: hypothetical protein H0T79_20400, partial [Deltaproteobacteria bacterium]|nr:hypothetical protein [Deltaproteobacteria bacterium]
MVASKPMPADAQTAAHLAVKPVASAGKPEFPTRGDMYRRAGLLGGAALLVGGIANADTPPPKPVEKAPVEAKQPAKD